MESPQLYLRPQPITIMKQLVIFLVLLLGFSLQALSQDKLSSKKAYTTTGGEIIFSWADLKVGGVDASTITRFSPVFNFQNQLHKNMNDHLGFFTGISVRNVGFIYYDPTTVNTKYKARNYTVGIPLAVKAGNMNGYCLFGGYELEIPFNYKEKKFVNEDKVSKSSSWFSNRTPGLYQALFVGIQTPFGSQIKFKYYLTNFFNKNYAAVDASGAKVFPYQNLDVNVFYISLSVQIFRGTRLDYK